MALLLDYSFHTDIVANPDGSFPVQLTGITAVQESIDSQLGHHSGAIDLGATGHGVVNLEGLPLDFARFCVRIVALVHGPVVARQNLVESSWLPFALFLTKERSRRIHCNRIGMRQRPRVAGCNDTVQWLSQAGHLVHNRPCLRRGHPCHLRRWCNRRGASFSRRTDGRVFRARALHRHLGRRCPRPPTGQGGSIAALVRNSRRSGAPTRRATQPPGVVH
jgi:hypothetical protein